MSTSIDALTLHHYDCSNESYNLDLGGGVELTLMLIPSGEFMMGSADEDIDASDFERPQHSVKLSQFLMGATPVTQAQWRVAAGYDVENIALKPEPSNFEGDDLPVEQVNWEEVTEFCQRLSKRTGMIFQIPSEAQWEYACRAGTTTPFHFGETITTDLANFDGNKTYADALKGKYRKQTTDVGSFPPNAFGLYDMHGNVREWCQDTWLENYNDAPADGSAWVDDGDDSNRVLRGGSWDDIPRNCRSASRNFDWADRDYGLITVGFRVVCGVGRDS